MKKIGLSLGSGGARGLAHIILLEAFDELGIKPNVISGTSVGAIIGAVYASGKTAVEIKEAFINNILNKSGRFIDFLNKSRILRAIDLVDLEFRSGGFVKGEKFLKLLSEEIGVKNFSDLQIPLKITATNFLTKKQSIFDEGKLLPALKASYSLPGLLAPVKINNNYFVDGGMVNPLPWDIIENDCDIIVAIDVLSNSKIKSMIDMPPAYDIFFSSFQIMQHSIVNEKLKVSKPDILIQTDIKEIRLLDFLKAESIFEQSEKYKSKLKRKLESLLG